MSKMSKKEQVTSTAMQKRVRFVGVPEEDQVKEASSSFQGGGGRKRKHALSALPGPSGEPLLKLVGKGEICLLTRRAGVDGWHMYDFKQGPLSLNTLKFGLFLRPDPSKCKDVLANLVSNEQESAQVRLLLDLRLPTNKVQAFEHNVSCILDTKADMRVGTVEREDEGVIYVMDHAKLMKLWCRVVDSLPHFDVRETLPLLCQFRLQSWARETGEPFVYRDFADTVQLSPALFANRDYGSFALVSLPTLFLHAREESKARVGTKDGKWATRTSLLTYGDDKKIWRMQQVSAEDDLISVACKKAGETPSSTTFEYRSFQNPNHYTVLQDDDSRAAQLTPDLDILFSSTHGACRGRLVEQLRGDSLTWIVREQASGATVYLSEDQIEIDFCHTTIGLRELQWLNPARRSSPDETLVARTDHWSASHGTVFRVEKTPLTNRSFLLPPPSDTVFAFAHELTFAPARAAAAAAATETMSTSESHVLQAPGTLELLYKERASQDDWKVCPRETPASLQGRLDTYLFQLAARISPDWDKDVLHLLLDPTRAAKARKGTHRVKLEIYMSATNSKKPVPIGAIVLNMSDLPTLDPSLPDTLIVLDHLRVMQLLELAAHRQQTGTKAPTHVNCTFVLRTLSLDKGRFLTYRPGDAIEIPMITLPLATLQQSVHIKKDSVALRVRWQERKSRQSLSRDWVDLKEMKEGDHVFPSAVPLEDCPERERTWIDVHHHRDDCTAGLVSVATWIFANHTKECVMGEYRGWQDPADYSVVSTGEKRSDELTIGHHVLFLDDNVWKQGVIQDYTSFYKGWVVRENNTGLLWHINTIDRIQLDMSASKPADVYWANRKTNERLSAELFSLKTPLPLYIIHFPDRRPLVTSEGLQEKVMTMAYGFELTLEPPPPSLDVDKEAAAAAAEMQQGKDDGSNEWKLARIGDVLEFPFAHEGRALLLCKEPPTLMFNDFTVRGATGPELKHVSIVIRAAERLPNPGDMALLHRPTHEGKTPMTFKVLQVKKAAAGEKAGYKIQALLTTSNQDPFWVNSQFVTPIWKDFSSVKLVGQRHSLFRVSHLQYTPKPLVNLMDLDMGTGVCKRGSGEMKHICPLALYRATGAETLRQSVGRCSGCELPLFKVIKIKPCGHTLLKCEACVIDTGACEQAGCDSLIWGHEYIQSK